MCVCVRDCMCVFVTGAALARVSYFFFVSLLGGGGCYDDGTISHDATGPHVIARALVLNKIEFGTSTTDRQRHA